MLVLSRNQNEEIEIDASHISGSGKIRLVVVEAKAGRVRLGFDADKSIAVNRREVADRMRNDPPHKRAG